MPNDQTVRDATRPLPPRLLAAGAIGTGLEFYDLIVYGLMAATLAPLFFPSESASASLIAVFAAFAVGLIARIAGGAIFGWLADRFTRRASLIGSILTMAVSSGLLAVLPTFATIGVAAPILLVVLRLAQGLAVGGELGVSYVFVREHAPKRHRVTAMSAVGAGPALGILFSASVVAVLHLALTDEQFTSFGWRIAFGLGVVIALVGLLIRRRVGDQAVTAAAGRKIWFDAARQSGRMILNVLALAGIAVGFVGLFVFVPTWAVVTLHADAQAAHFAPIAGALAALVVLPFCGRLGDYIGARITALIGTVVLAVALVPLLSVFTEGSTTAMVLVFCFLGALTSVCIPSIAALTVGLYRHTIRGLSASLVFNVAYGAIGGTTPVIAMWLNETTGNPLAFAWYLAGLCVLSSIVLIALRPQSFGPQSFD